MAVRPEIVADAANPFSAVTSSPRSLFAQRNGRASGVPSGRAFRVPCDPNPLSRSSEAGKESYESGCPQTVGPVCAVTTVEAPAGTVLLDADALRPNLSPI